MTFFSTPNLFLPRRTFAPLCVIALALLASSCSLDSASQKAATERRQARQTAGGGAPTQAPATSRPMPPATTAAQQAAAADRGWTLLDGRRARLDDFRGQVLVLDFYATFCQPCRQEIPHLVALQSRYAAEGVQVIGLNVGGVDDYPKVPQFVKELSISYPLGNPDPGFSEPFFMDNTAIPQTYVFDRQGRVVKRFIGYDPTLPGELEAAVKTALAAEAD